MTERDQDLGPRRLLAQEPDDFRAQDRGRIRGQRRDALRVEEHHARPADATLRSVGSFEVHDEEVALVVEHMLPEDEVRQRLAADVLEEREMLLAALERLFHRDHAVPEHACLAHSALLRSASRTVDKGGEVANAPSPVDSQQIHHPITIPLSRKISRAMINR
jgi:hypothetical protein